MTNSLRLRGRADAMAEMANRTAAMISIFLRPKRSLSVPASEAPTMQPISTLETAQPCITSSSSNRSVRKPMTPEITPVSYPKSKPPKAATAAKPQTYAVLPLSEPPDGSRFCGVFVTFGSLR